MLHFATACCLAQSQKRQERHNFFCFDTFAKFIHVSNIDECSILTLADSTNLEWGWRDHWAWMFTAMKQKWWRERKYSRADKAVRPCLWKTMEWRRFPLKRGLLLAYTTFNQGCRDKSSQFISHSQFKRCHAQAMYLLTSVPPSKARQEEWC